MINISDIVASIGNECNEKEINVFWFEYFENREELKKKIELESKDLIVLVLKDNLFINPNMLMSDLIYFFSIHKDDIIGKKNEICKILILTKSKLNTPQVSSPATLPEWFPVYPNQTVSIIIKNLGFRLKRALSEDVIDINSISERIYHLEKIVVKRIIDQYNSDHNKINTIVDLIKKDDTSIKDTLELIKAHIDEVKNPGLYRVGLKNKNSLFSILLSKYLSISQNEKYAFCDKIYNSIGIKYDDKLIFDYSFFSFICRPQVERFNVGQIVILNLMDHLYCYYQIMNGIAHKDQYPLYNYYLLDYFINDMVQTLDKLIDVLDVE